MLGSHEIPKIRRETVPEGERVLSEVDNLIANRLPDGTYPENVLNDVSLNLMTATQEAAMPYAVTTTKHEAVYDPEKQKRTFMWLGKTAVEAAMSGYKFHVDDSAIERVDIEVDEARHTEDCLKPGVMKVFISPRMSRADASLDIAKQEHLAEDDAVRVSWLETDKNSRVTNRVLQSLLVRDVPLSAWVSLLEDSNNVFKKGMNVDSPDSAASVMKLHRELEVPMGELSEGPVSIVEAVLPYIQDDETRQSVKRQLELFRGDQDDLCRQAESVAERWLDFEVELANSVKAKVATPKINSFIVGLQHQWGEKDLEVIKRHMLPNAGHAMPREMAALVERAKQNFLWASAGASTGNSEVIKQMDPVVAARIADNEVLIQAARFNGMNTHALEVANNRLVASQNVKVGGGCAGKNDGQFNTSNNPNNIPGESNGDSDDSDETDWKWKQGVCRVDSCASRPGTTDVGPCSICRSCQAEFDAGNDPTKRPAKVTQATNTKKESKAVKLRQKEATAVAQQNKIDEELRLMLAREEIERIAKPSELALV